MIIAIIGTGHVGSAVARGAVRVGHIVRLAAAHPEHAEALAREIGATAAASNAEAVEPAEMIVLAVPPRALGGIVEEIRPHAAGKTVVDVTNSFNEDVTDVRPVTSTAEELQELLPEAHVVKALNYAFAANMATGSADDEQIDGYYAGDDEGARSRVGTLLGELGFVPVDVGPLALARVLESMALLIVRLNRENGWSWRNGWKLVGPR